MKKKLFVTSLIILIAGMGIWHSSIPEKINSVIIEYEIQKELSIGVPFESIKKKYDLKLINTFEEANAWRPKKNIPKKTSYFLNETETYTAKVEVWATTKNPTLVKEFVLIDSKLKSESIFYFGADNLNAQSMKKNLYKWFGKPVVITSQFQICEEEKNGVQVWIKFRKADSKQTGENVCPDDITSFDSYEVQLRF